jgi:hypothetical protein
MGVAFISQENKGKNLLGLWLKFVYVHDAAQLVVFDFNYEGCQDLIQLGGEKIL